MGPSLLPDSIGLGEARMAKFELRVLSIYEERCASKSMEARVHLNGLKDESRAGRDTVAVWDA
jgi:hypothetical protein